MVMTTGVGEGEANSSPMDLPDGGVDATNLRYFVMALFFMLVRLQRWVPFSPRLASSRIRVESRKKAAI